MICNDCATAADTHAGRHPNTVPEHSYALRGHDRCATRPHGCTCQHRTDRKDPA